MILSIYILALIGLYCGIVSVRPEFETPLLLIFFIFAALVGFMLLV